MLDYDTIDTQAKQFNAMLTQLEAALASNDEDDRRDALDYLSQEAVNLGGVFSHESIRTRTETSRDYTDGSGETQGHAATDDAMQDLAIAVRKAAEPAEAALIVATALRSMRKLVHELKVWTDASAQVGATRESYPDGMTRDQALAYLAAKGRTIKPGTWSAYVARNQAPQAARKFGRTPLWNPADVAAFAEGTWEAARAE